MEVNQKAMLGKKIGRYELRQIVGEGGMATVFRAYDMRLEREVAVKLFRREAFSPAVARRMLKRFDREAKALARLSHPNIVEVLDYGSFEDSLYLVMKYMPGGTLKEKAEETMTYPAAARLIAPVARALDYAHREGIIHRDVKPANILLTKGGDPMLSDFGIAKIVEENKSMSLTATNVGVGTPEYMAPEQWVNKVSPRSDIYALGIIFYELVTGTKPYAADTPAGVAIKQATEPVPDPRRFIIELPDHVVHVILKALARRPEDRYESMGDFAIALEKLSMDDFHLIPDRIDETADDIPSISAPTEANIPLDSAPASQPIAIYTSNGRRWGWLTIHLGLSLMLGVLTIAAAFMWVDGVVVAPLTFYIPPANLSLPQNLDQSIKPYIDPLYRPVATAVGQVLSGLGQLGTASPASATATPAPNK